MPAIARGADDNHAKFYLHLGDLRATYKFDEDIAKALGHPDELLISDYLGDENANKVGEWQDFKENQVVPFGQIPFFVGIGNHETIFPQSRTRFEKYFSELLNRPELRDQRVKDLPGPHAPDPGAKTYFHWNMGSVDFIYLDNASQDQFDAAQLKWFEDVLRQDDKPAITTLVVGMHAALPYSISLGHSMNEWAAGEKSGVQVYNDLLQQKKAGKEVYVLASHSHFFMEGIFNTSYWKANGGVLDGWIVGTAGAERYRLPGEANMAKNARTGVYGYLLGTVDPKGPIKFEFHELHEKDVPVEVLRRYPRDFVNWCFDSNKK